MEQILFMGLLTQLSPFYFGAWILNTGCVSVYKDILLTLINKEWMLKRRWKKKKKRRRGSRKKDMKNLKDRENGITSPPLPSLQLSRKRWSLWCGVWCSLKTHNNTQTPKHPAFKIHSSLQRLKISPPNHSWFHTPCLQHANSIPFCSTYITHHKVWRLSFSRICGYSVVHTLES